MTQPYSKSISFAPFLFMSRLMVSLSVFGAIVVVAMYLSRYSGWNSGSRFEEIEVFNSVLGDVWSGDFLIHKVLVSNNSDSPFKVSGSRSSCSCAVPVDNLPPIEPGSTGEIPVELKLSRREQASRVVKFSIVLESSHGAIPLVLRANVLPWPISQSKDGLALERSGDNGWEGDHVKISSRYPIDHVEFKGHGVDVEVDEVSSGVSEFTARAIGNSEFEKFDNPGIQFQLHFLDKEKSVLKFAVPVKYVEKQRVDVFPEYLLACGESGKAKTVFNISFTGIDSPVNSVRLGEGSSAKQISEVPTTNGMGMVVQVKFGETTEDINGILEFDVDVGTTTVVLPVAYSVTGGNRK